MVTIIIIALVGVALVASLWDRDYFGLFGSALILLALWGFFGGMVATIGSGVGSSGTSRQMVVEDGVAREVIFYCENQKREVPVSWFWPGMTRTEYVTEGQVCWGVEE